MTAAHPHDAHIRALYAEFLDGWNRRSGAAVAAGFADDGDIIGFDGSHHQRPAVHRRRPPADLRQPPDRRPTSALVRSVRPIATASPCSIAHAGTSRQGGNDFDPSLHAVHTLVAVDEGGPLADLAVPGHAGGLAPSTPRPATRSPRSCAGCWPPQ